MAPNGRTRAWKVASMEINGFESRANLTVRGSIPLPSSL